MDDNEFSTSMDSESEDDGISQDGMESQITEDEFSTVRNDARQFGDERHDGDEHGRSAPGTEEEEEEMDYTSGNEYQDDVGETSVREGDMFYSCHEDFHQISGFSEPGERGMEGGGPCSPDGSPPESPGTANSESEAAEFDYATPSETETSVRLQSERLEREGEEFGGIELATPASPLTSTAESADDSEPLLIQESEGVEHSDNKDEESDLFDRGGDERAPSPCANVVESSSEEHDETLKSPTVPCYGQDESYDQRTRVCATSDADLSAQELQDEEAAEEDYRDGEQLFQEGDDESNRLSKLSGDEEDGNDNNHGDQSTEDVDSRTRKDDDRLLPDQEDNEQEMHKDRHKGDGNEDDDDHLDLTVPTKDAKSSRKYRERSEAAVVEVHHIEDHGDELDFEEDVEDHAQPYHQEPSGEQAEEEEEEEEEEEKKESVVKEEKMDDPQQDDKRDEDSEGDGEVKDDDDGECVEAEEGEDGELDDDDMEEGEVKDPVEKKKPEVRPTCRFYTRGQCFWGNNCRFIHPGINDKGNYSLIDRRELHNAQAVLLGQPLEPPSPPPKEEVPPSPVEEEEEFLPPPPEEPRPESAWERGLRHARELRKKAMQLKEKGVLPEEQKTIGDMIDEENDFDKENEFFPEKADIDDAFMQGDVYPPEQYPYPMPPEHHERHFNFREQQQQPSPPRQVYRVQQDFNDPRRRMMNQGRQRNDWQQNNFNRNRQQQFRGQRPQQQQQQPPFRRGRSPPGGFVDKRRDDRPGAMRNLPRRDKPGMRAGDGGPMAGGKSGKDKAADSWQDPWARTKSPGKKGRSAPGGGRRPRSRSNSSASYSDRSYSSRSRSRSDSRSRSRSYSSRSRSSSRSSYSGSSRSRSRSKSPGSQSYSSFSSRSRSRSPPPKLKGRLGAAKPIVKPIAKPGAQPIAKPGSKPAVKAPAKPIASSKPAQSQQQRGQVPSQGRPPGSRPTAGRPVVAKQPGGRPPGAQPSVKKPVGSGPPPPKAAPTKMSDKQPPVKGKSAFPKPVPMNRRSRSRTRSESLSSISSRSSYSSYSRSRSRSHSRSYSRSSSSSRSRSRSRSRSLTRSRPVVPRQGQPRPGQSRPGQPRPGQPRPGQPRPGQPRPGQPRPGQHRPEPPRSGPPRSGPPRPEAVRPVASRPGGPRSARVRPISGAASGRPPPRHSRSFSGSRSRSRSRSSSVSSRSSVSSADSENMYANLASPVSSASSTEMAPVPKRVGKGTKGPSKPPSAVSSSMKPTKTTKPPSKPSPQTVRPTSSKKVTKVPVGKPTPDRSATGGKVQPRGGPVGKAPSKASSGERPSSSTKVQGAQRPSSTTTQQPKMKPARGTEGKTGAKPPEQKMKERGPPVASSSTSRPSSSNQQGILKHAARKEIKLNLISKTTDESKKRPAEPSSTTRPEKKSKLAPERDHKVGSSTVKQQATSSTDVKHPSAKVSSTDRKRASSPPPSKSQPATKAPKSALKPAPKKESLSRREEILKQLQAVEDLIRKKKAKLK